MGGQTDDPEGNDEPQRPLVGGRYRVDSLIGTGGMAEVWSAEDVRLRRPVAVKFLTFRGPGEAEEHAQQRFLREARIAASVRHPNVVDVLDFGCTQEGRPYMVMERLEGESLEERLLCAGSLALDELLRIALDALTGLDVVHRNGIVHRDLKPANIFLLEGADPVQVKLIDFGVSRATAVSGGRRSVLTTINGRLVGTPAYMSPEQARGRSDVDLRADLYCLGAILYEGLTGRLPYLEEATGDLIIAIAAGGAPTVAELRPEIGEAISSVIERAMMIERDDRFQSAIEMGAALLAATDRLGTDVRPSLPMPPLARQLAGIPTPGSNIATIDVVPANPSTRPANGTPQFAIPPTTRRPWWLAIAAAVALAMISGGAWFWLRPPAPEPSASIAPAVPESRSPSPESAPAATPSLGAESDQTHVMGDGADENLEPEPAPTVRLTLEGLPANARVFVDGEPAEVTDAVLVLRRDDEEHLIEARVRGARWRVQRHVADDDATLRVRMTRRVRRTPRRRPNSSGLFDELDY